MQVWPPLFYAGLARTVLWKFDPDCFMQVWSRLWLIQVRPQRLLHVLPRLFMLVRRQQFYAGLTLTVLWRFNPDVFMQVWPWLLMLDWLLLFIFVWPWLFHAGLTLTVLCRFDSDCFITGLTLTVWMQVWPWLPSWQGRGGPEADGDQLGGNKTNICVIWIVLTKHNLRSGNS